MHDAIILDGHLKSALAAARSLHRAGIRTVCGAGHRSAPVLHSRSCAVPFTYPDPLDDLSGFVDAVSRRVPPDGAVLYTFSDRTTLAISRNRNRLPANLRLLMPDAATVEKCFDKGDLAAAARELDIPVPGTFESPDRSRLESLGYPVIIKPRMNCAWSGNTGVCVSVVRAADAPHAAAALDDLRKRTGTAPLIQRFAPGREYGVTALCRDGQVLALSAHRRIRSLSPDGGASVVKEAIPVPDSFRDAAVRILEHLRWTGPAMVEFKGEPGDLFVLMEVNGRFWGSLPLAIEAGLDFPVLAHRMASGQDIPPSYARPGVLTHHLLGEAGWLFRSLMRGQLRAAGIFLKSLSGQVKDDVWDRTDPAPFFWDIWHSILH